MKKLILGKGLEERKATCNFCEEKEKECIKGALPLKVVYPTQITEMKQVPVGDLKLEKVIDDYEIKFWSGNKVFEDYKDKYVCDSYTYKEVVIGEKKETLTQDVDICKDCIKQLVKLI